MHRTWFRPVWILCMLSQSLWAHIWSCWCRGPYFVFFFVCVFSVLSGSYTLSAASPAGLPESGEGFDGDIPFRDELLNSLTVRFNLVHIFFASQCQLVDKWIIYPCSWIWAAHKIELQAHRTWMNLRHSVKWKIPEAIECTGLSSIVI